MRTHLGVLSGLQLILAVLFCFSFMSVTQNASWWEALFGFLAFMYLAFWSVPRVFGDLIALHSVLGTLLFLLTDVMAVWAVWPPFSGWQLLALIVFVDRSMAMVVYHAKQEHLNSLNR